MPRFGAFLFVLLPLTFGGHFALSQSDAAAQHPGGTPHLGDQDQDANPARAAMEAKAKQQRYVEQQKKWIADATKLVTLADELKSSLDKTSVNQIPVDLIQKAAEIEKLSKHLKEQMRNP